MNDNFIDRLGLRLNFSIQNYSFLQLDELELKNFGDHFTLQKPANIYFLLSRNKVRVGPNLKFSKDDIEINFSILNKDFFLPEKIKVNHVYSNLKEVKINSEYPYQKFTVVDEHGSCLISGKSAYFLEKYYDQLQHPEYLDYEVLYIGQSVNVKNALPVVMRLDSHSTLKNILSAQNSKNPDKELFLLFCAIKQDAAMNIPVTATEEEKKQLVAKLYEFYSKKTNESVKQQMSLCEACLIHYFKPYNNHQFVTKAPTRAHRSFRDLSSLSLSEVCIEVNLDFAPKLYTETTGRLDNHSKVFLW